MNAKLQRWMPVALCCLPGIAAAVIVGIGLAAGGTLFGVSLGGPLGLGLIALAMLACPISMGLMMWRGSRRNAASGNAATMADCCAPGEMAPTTPPPADRLTALRAEREALERELAQMHTQ